MVPTFDIFRFDSNRRLIWKESAGSLEVAQSRIQVLRDSDPGDYLIFSQATGEKFVVVEESQRCD